MLDRSCILQNTADLSDLVSSGRDKKPEEISFAEECSCKSLAFRAERFASFKQLLFLWILGMQAHTNINFSKKCFSENNFWRSKVFSPRC